MITVSVITVCLNAEQDIKDTINSVLMQEFSNIEYIIKDGISKDKTIEIVNSYAEKFLKRNIEYRLISEKDSGIYDAMNQASNIANGEWIIFLNAGDRFYDNCVLKDIFNTSFIISGDLLVGHTLYQLVGGMGLISCHNLDYLDKEVCYCHQSILTRRKLLIQDKFDCKYKILADYDWLIRIMQKGYVIEPVNSVICKFKRNGISAINIYATTKEFLAVQEKYYERSIRIKHITLFVKTYINKRAPIIGDISFAFRQMKRIGRYINEK